MFWEHLYCLLAWATLGHALIPMRVLYGRNHVLGAEIIVASWIASYVSRQLTGDWSPIEWSALIDIMAGAGFVYIASRKMAIWAALCGIYHGLMLVLHFAFEVSGQFNETAYLWALNGLFMLTLITINIAISAGRHEWGERMDEFCFSRLRGWTWSGVHLPRRGYT